MRSISPLRVAPVVLGELLFTHLNPSGSAQIAHSLPRRSVSWAPVLNQPKAPRGLELWLWGLIGPLIPHSLPPGAGLSVANPRYLPEWDKTQHLPGENKGHKHLPGSPGRTYYLLGRRTLPLQASGCRASGLPQIPNHHPTSQHLLHYPGREQTRVWWSPYFWARSVYNWVVLLGSGARRTLSVANS